MNKLIIFDIDGTLFDTFDDIYDSLVHTLKKHSYPIPSVDDAKKFVGDGLKIFIARATGNGESPDMLPQDVLEDYVKYYNKNIVVNTKPFEGVVDTIKNLYADGYRLAVVSNKSEFLVKGIVEHFGMTHYFNYIAGGDTFDEKKPSPLPILSLLNIFHADGIESAVMVGDSINDVLSAKLANIKVIYCRYGYGNEISTEPDYYVDSAYEIYNAVKMI